MRRRYARPGYTHFPKNIGNPGGNLLPTISGAYMTANFGAHPAATFPFINQNRLIALALSVAAPDANMIVESITVDGVDIPIWTQINVGGALVAIAGGFVPITMDPGRNPFFRSRLSASGAAAAQLLFNYTEGFSSQAPTDVKTASNTAATNLSVNLNVETNSLVMAAALNDVATANACAWTGTAGVIEQTDTTIGTMRSSLSRSNVPTRGTSQSVTATYDVSSSAGIVLAAATWR